MLTERETKAVIPSKTSRRERIRLDRDVYRQRNVIERMLGRLKDFRRIATRYDKLAGNFLSGICIAAAIVYWVARRSCEVIE
jgi:transposase